MRIDQYASSIAQYDAVSNNVFYIQEILRSQGYISEIFTDNPYPGFEKQTKHSTRYRGKKDHILIIHYSIGSDFYKRLPDISSKKVLIYHNITPAYFFEEWSPTLYQASKSGINQLQNIAPYIDKAVGDSRYNTLELKQYGYQNAQTLPLLYKLPNINSTQDAKLQRNLRQATNILFVGRIAPNKRQEDLIKTFYLYQKYFNQNSKLYLVGGYRGFEYYYDSLKQLIAGLGLEKHIIITGYVSNTELTTYYRNSHLFLSMSEHEGFCIPIVEAMQYKLPILAYSKSGALPETLGTGGILFNEKNIFKVAALVDYIIDGKNSITKILQKNQDIELKNWNETQRIDEFLNICEELKKL